MLTAYERHLIVFYLANAAGRLHHRDREASALAGWLASSAYNQIKNLYSRLIRNDIELDEPITARQLRRLKQALRDECASTKATKPDRTAQRLQCLGKATGLEAIDVDILEVLLRYRTQPAIESMVDDIFGYVSQHMKRATHFYVHGAAIPTLLGVSPGSVQRRFANGAPLVSSGLVVINTDGGMRPVDRLQRLATVHGRAGLDVNRLLLDAAPGSELEWADFDHIAEGRGHIERLIRGALRTGAPGVNVLLYGPPGTGKTEFCKVLAERLGATLYSVGEANDYGEEPDRYERLQDLRLAQHLLKRNGASLLLFDEMEDLLGSGMFHLWQPLFAGTRGGSSKVYMHRLLERAPAPTLWTMNNARSVSRALLRRMMFALELRPPTAAVRARIWTRQLEHHGIKAGPDEADALAREFAAAPGVTAGAVAAARIGGGGIETVRRGVRELSRVLSCDAPPQGKPPLFDPSLIQADIDPVALADSLVAGGSLHFSLCLQGPPGTGKSAFVRYLAERMGIEVMQKRASDLISMWVGETEKEIAAAFAEARDTGSFLVFDEADSLLADRRFAQRSWEVSRVNEMLTWMESHPLPFACTTNFGEHLDAATLRRFVFKVALDYLSAEQVETAFRAYFGMAPPARAATLTALTPGDFAVVRKKAALLRQLDEPEALSAMLSAECAAKPDRPRPISFIGST